MFMVKLSRRRKVVTEDEHKQRHIELHRALDELLADFILATKEPPLNQPIRNLLEWAYQQTIEPDHDPNR